MPRSAKGPAPVRVAYFAHDWNDAAIKRRVAGFERDGISVAGFASYRTDQSRPNWVVADLGRTYDNGYLRRAASVFRGAKIAQGAELNDADLIVARNLDMLLTALFARRRAGLSTPVVYECLDIHRLVARRDQVGTIFRAIERRALRQCTSAWVSSPAFLTEHFERHYPEFKGSRLLENRLQDAIGARPRQASTAQTKLRIGWFGNLRCRRSLLLLADLSERFAGEIEIYLRGYPATAEITDFQAIIDAHPGLRFGGRYSWPDELETIYGDVDIVWAGDFMDAGLNSQWLLPNRLYEGGWYGCPPVAPKASQTGHWIETRQSGFVLAEPIERSLPELIETLLKDRTPITEARTRLLGLPDDVFIEPRGTLWNLVEEAIEPANAVGSSSREKPKPSIAASL